MNRNIRGIMEAVLYQNYLYLNYQKYGYQLISVDYELKYYLTSNQEYQYRKAFFVKYNGSSGLLERAMMSVTKNTVKGISKIIRNNHIKIIRCDKTDLNNYGVQNYLFKKVKPNILACSQNHWFGLNRKSPWWITKQLLKRKGDLILRKISPSYRNIINVKKEFNIYINHNKKNLSQLKQFERNYTDSQLEKMKYEISEEYRLDMDELRKELIEEFETIINRGPKE